MGDPTEAYRLYSAAVLEIPAVQQVFAKNGRYVYHDQMTLEQTQTLLEATDLFVLTWAEGSEAVLTRPNAKPTKPSTATCVRVNIDMSLFLCL